MYLWLLPGPKLNCRFTGFAWLYRLLYLHDLLFIGNRGLKELWSGTILNVSFVFWIPALSAMFGLLTESIPVYSAWCLFIAVLGCLAGAHFGLMDVYSGVSFIFDIRTIWLPGLNVPLHSNLLLFAIVPIFPISLAVLAAICTGLRSCRVEWLLYLDGGIIISAGARILRKERLAHGNDTPAIYLHSFYCDKNKCHCRPAR